MLDPGCLVSSLSSISIGPGETAQPIHADDQLIPIPKPHPPMVCNTMWALTDFTEANGATRLVPGCHLADHAPTSARDYDTVPAEMAEGQRARLARQPLARRRRQPTDERRVGIAMNYCAGYIRQQENQQLGIPREVAAVLAAPPRAGRLRHLHGLIGHIDKHDPSSCSATTAPQHDDLGRPRDRGRMGQAIGDLLPSAVGVALGPLPIIAVILMLGAPKARVQRPGVRRRLGARPGGRQRDRVVRRG